MIGATVVIFLGGILVLIGTATVYLIANTPPGARPDPMVLRNSSFAIVGFALTTPVTLGLTWYFAGLCHPGRSAADFLGLKRIALPTLLRWCGATLLFVAVGDSITFLLDRPIVPDVMIDDYLGANSKLLLLAGVIILAPLLEETVMRGFLLEGLRFTKVRLAGAIALSAGVWAIMHLQYDWYGITQILVYGILLGVARFRTGSLLTVIAMHALNNIVSTVELLIVLEQR